MPTIRTRIRRVLILAAGVLTLLLGVPLAAQADTLDKTVPTLQDRVDAVLAEYPGGTQIAPNEISWNSGAVILTFEARDFGIGLFAVGSCATGSYCAYSGYSLTGNKLSFTSCANPQPVGVLGTVRSIANARTAGSIQAQNSGGGGLATIAANSSLPFAPSGVAYLACL